MSDESTEQVEDAEADADAPAVLAVQETFYRHADTGEIYVISTDPNGVTTDLPAQSVSVAEYEAALARVTDLEAKAAELEAYIDQLEADPYRPVVTDQNGDVTEGLLFFEAQSQKAEQQARERDGVVFEEAEVVPVDSAVEAEV